MTVGDPVQGFVEELRVLPGVVRVRTWRLGTPLARVYVRMVQPRGAVAPEVVVDLQSRKVGTLNWPPDVRYNRSYGGTVDRIMSLATYWTFEVPVVSSPSPT